jgi:hypothetical protein
MRYCARISLFCDALVDIEAGQVESAAAVLVKAIGLAVGDDGDEVSRSALFQRTCTERKMRL